MTSRAWGPPVVLLLSMAAMSAGLVADGASPARTLMAVCFLAIAPGLSLVGLLGLSDPWLEAALVPAVSLSLDAIVGGVLSYTGAWSTTTAMLVLVVVSVLGAFGQLLLRRTTRTR
jgi:hypothetical protein